MLLVSQYLAAVTCVAGLLIAEAHAAGPSAEEPPLVLVVDTAGKPAFRGLRERFARELGLTLDEFATVRVKVPPEFSQQSLAEQLRVVKPLIKRYRAIAATWIDRPLPEVVLVTMMVVESGRTVVRTIPAEPRAGNETELALVARELLGTVYMFDPNRPPAVDEIVAETIQVAAKASATAPTPTDPRLFALRVGAGVTGAADSSRRWPPGLRVDFGLHVSFPMGLELHGLMELRGGRQEYTKLGRVEHMAASVRLGAGARFGTERFGVVPGLSARLGFQRNEVSPHYALRHTDDRFTALLAVATEGYLQWGQAVRVFVSPELLWDLQPSTLRLRSTGEVAIETPRLHWGMSVGVLTFW